MTRLTDGKCFNYCVVYESDDHNAQKNLATASVYLTISTVIRYLSSNIEKMNLWMSAYGTL